MPALLFCWTVSSCSSLNEDEWDGDWSWQWWWHLSPCLYNKDVWGGGSAASCRIAGFVCWVKYMSCISWMSCFRLHWYCGSNLLWLLWRCGVRWEKIGKVDCRPLVALATWKSPDWANESPHSVIFTLTTMIHRVVPKHLEIPAVFNITQTRCMVT